MHKVTLELFWGESENKPKSVDTEAIYLPGEGKGRSFTWHIAKPEPFSSQKFILSLAESGAIADVHFVKTTGAGAALEAGNSVLAPLQPQTEAANRANAMKAQTDVEYEQQRVAACKASPSVNNCK
ncbi:hypothetical protein [Paraburkholderia bannensis]|uniref:hypothetical protein n=1 Tax=Paraburkholderia bannensis TaxID=765414 RepID=UPI002ABDAE0E|nr:hypothetical protein [Paraburkholderia bannensis]